MTHIDPDGRTWLPFDVHYQADGMTLSFTLWAVSYEHAVLLLEDIKTNAQVFGQIVERIDV